MISRKSEFLLTNSVTIGAQQPVSTQKSALMILVSVLRPSLWRRFKELSFGPRELSEKLTWKSSQFLSKKQQKLTNLTKSLLLDLLLHTISARTVSRITSSSKSLPDSAAQIWVVSLMICLLLRLSVVILETKPSPNHNSYSRLQMSTFLLNLIVPRSPLSMTQSVEFLYSKLPSIEPSKSGKLSHKSMDGHHSELQKSWVTTSL